MNNNPTSKDVSANGLILTSSAFGEKGDIPLQYTCKGQNTSPPLTISGVPASAKSLALIVHDPDAVGSDFTHWVLYDIAVSTTMIAANSLPAGALQGPNGAGRTGYMGPCPPAGTGIHRYMFELFALDKTFGSQNLKREQLESAMQGHVLAKIILTGLFSAD